MFFWNLAVKVFKTFLKYLEPAKDVLFLMLRFDNFSNKSSGHKMLILRFPLNTNFLPQATSQPLISAPRAAGTIIYYQLCSLVPFRSL